MNNGADWQQQPKILEQEYLLTKEAFHDWIYNHKLRELAEKLMNSQCENLTELYLGEHGLPITSKIEGV